MPDKIVHKIHLDRYAPMPTQIQLGTVESYGVEQIAVVAGAGWDGLDIVAVYHPPKAAEPVRVLVPSDGLSDVPPEATASAGRGALVIAGMADGVQIASCNIAYTVIAQAGTDGTTGDTPTPDLVQQILSAANGAVKTADGVRADMDKVLEAESGRETAEADRAAAESARVTAETARAEAEADRAAAEEERQSAESARIAAENDRQSAETSRARAETARESAETDRVAAEAARVNAEAERADYERLRKDHESQRVTDETARQTAESKRQEAETARVGAESKRADAEQSRVKAETDRVTSETARKDAESKRASAEQERQTAEQGRTEAETARVEAEAEREKQLPELRTAVYELKEDLGNINDVLNIDEKEGKAQSVAGWKNVTILTKKVRPGETYKVDVVFDSAPVNSAYIYIKASGTLLKNYQVKGLTSVSYERKADKEEEWSVEIGAENYTGFVSAKIYNAEPNNIKKINNDIVQVQHDLANQVSLTKRTLYELFEMVHGGVEEFEIGAAKYRVATKDIIYFPDDVAVTVSDDFRVGVVTYNGFSPSEYNWLGWKRGSTVIKKGFARIQIAKVDESTSEIADIEEYSKSVSLEYEKIIEINQNPNRNVLFYTLRKGTYFSHIDVDYYDGLIIPSQSIFDIKRAKRLGFKMMELNARKTSDGVFYAFHGHQGCFGNAFHSVDNSDISSIHVSTVTSEYIQNNIRYNSKYEKYRTAPATLEDALIECKKNEIVPLVEYSTGIIDLVKSIMGDNNYFIGTYTNDRTPDLENCVCVSWITGTAEDVIEKAEKSKAPYVCGINVTSDVYSSYTEDDWRSFIGKIHKAGYFVSCSYQNPLLGQKLLSSGIDMMASHGEINEIENGNIFDSESEMNFSEFTSDGNVLNGVLNLTAGQTVKPTGIDDTVFLGGSSLHIIFSGKIHVLMGIVDNYFESDGSKEIWLSSFYQENVPTFKITAITETNIFELSYKASKM